MKIRPSAKRTFSLLLAAAFLTAAAAGYVFFVKPAYKDVIGLRGVLQAKDKFLQIQSAAIAKVNNLITQYQGNGKLQDTISLSFPLRENLSSIFNQLRALADLNGLSVEIFGVKPLAFKSLTNEQPLVKNVGTLQLSVKLSGPYTAFKNFLKGLETNIRIMDVQNISIEKLGAVGDFFAYALTINTYYQEN